MAINGMLASLLMAAGGVGADAAAPTRQDLDAVVAAAHQFLTAKWQERSHSTNAVEIQVQPPDQRLQLPPCQRPLDAFLPSGARSAGRTTVGVRCPAPHWQLFLRAVVRRWDEVVVMRRPLARGERLTRAHLALERRELSGLSRGYFTAIDQVARQQSRRRLRAGQVVTPASVEPPLAIARGDRVVVQVKKPGFTIAVEAEALEDARVGERLQLRNISSGRTLEGIATGPQQAAIRGLF